MMKSDVIQKIDSINEFVKDVINEYTVDVDLFIYLNENQVQINVNKLSGKDCSFTQKVLENFCVNESILIEYKHGQLNEGFSFRTPNFYSKEYIKNNSMFNNDVLSDMYESYISNINSQQYRRKEFEYIYPLVKKRIISNGCSNIVGMAIVGCSTIA